MKKFCLLAVATVFIFGNVYALGYSFSSNLKVGDRGDMVSELQTFLITHGFSIPLIESGIAAKGYFGLQTKNAVIAYQKSVGLPSTGFFGPLTRGVVNKVVESIGEISTPIVQSEQSPDAKPAKKEGVRYVSRHSSNNNDEEEQEEDEVDDIRIDPADYSPENPFRVNFLGDSITSGVYGSYREHMMDYFLAAGFEEGAVETVGLYEDGSGFFSAAGGAGYVINYGFGTIHTLWDATVEHDPQLVYLIAGVNELGNDISPEDTADLAKVMLDEIFIDAPNTCVVLASMIPFFGSYVDALIDETNPLLYSEVYQVFHDQGKCIFWSDLNTVFKERYDAGDILMASDNTDVHPQNDGNRLIAQTFFKTDIFVQDVVAPSFVTTDLDVAPIDQDYSFTLEAGGTGPFVWDVVGGELLESFTLNRYTGEISGFGDILATTTFTVQLTGFNTSVTEEFTLEVYDTGSLRSFLAFLWPFDYLDSDEELWWYETNGNDYYGLLYASSSLNGVLEAPGVTEGYSGPFSENSFLVLDPGSELVAFHDPEVNGDFTVALWVKFDEFPVLGTSTLFSEQGYYDLYLDNDEDTRILTFSLWTDENEKVIATSTYPNDTEEWHLVTVTHDGTEKEIAVSVDAGVPGVYTYTGAAYLSASEPNMYVGAEYCPDDEDYCNYFSGQIDQLITWNKALSSDQITTLYHAGVPLTADGLFEEVLP